MRDEMRDNYDPYALCPCGLNEKAKFCCKQGKWWFKQPANISPKPPITMLSNNSCYAQSLADCDDAITGEHCISKALLSDISKGKSVEIAGFKWQQPQTFLKVGIKSLTANVLCARHNNALSPLDSAFARFNAAIDEFQKTQKNSVAKIEPDFRLFSGLDIERWMLKTLIGLAASNNLSSTEMRPHSLEILYGKEPWTQGAGLYLDINGAMYESDSFLLETMTTPDGTTILAGKFTICGLRLMLLIGKPESIPSSLIRHPTTIIFAARGVEKIIELSWEAPEPMKFVRFERQDAEFDGAPPDWQDWEKR